MKILKLTTDYLKTITKDIMENEIPNRAAATAFTTILCLVPLTNVLFFFFSRLTLFSELREHIQIYILKSILPSNYLASEINKYLIQFCKNTASFNITSIILMFIASIFLISQVENHFNKIWESSRNRSTIKRIIIYYPVLLSTPFLIALLLFVSTLLQNVLKSTTMYNFILIQFLSFLLILSILTILNKYLPSSRVKWKWAFFAGFIGAMLWEMLKLYFNVIIAYTVKYNIVYGSIAIIPMFFLYIYFSWIVIFFAAQCGSSFQNRRFRLEYT